MSGPLDRVDAKIAVARDWNAQGLEYSVAHGLEGYPRRLGRDLDILMDQNVAVRALRSACHTLKSVGWESIACPPDVWGKRIVGLRELDGRFEYLELHTMAYLRWELMQFVSASEPPSTCVGPFPVSGWATFVKSVLLPLLANDISRFNEEYISYLPNLGVSEKLIVARGRHLLGGDLAHELAASAMAPDTEAVVGLASRLRRVCRRRMLGRPAASLTALSQVVWAKSRRLLTTTGAHVVVQVPVDADAEALAAGLSDILSGVFVDVALTTRDRTGAMGVRRSLRARQGVLVMVASEPGGSITARLSSPRSRADPRLQPTCRLEGSNEEEMGRDLARWIIRQWARAFACGQAY